MYLTLQGKSLFSTTDIFCGISVKMARFHDIGKRVCVFILYKFPLLDALSLLMLFGERAAKESIPPINPKLVYAYLIACIGCAVLLSAGFKQKAACLVYAGQLLYFAANFYNNPKWDYPEWQRMLMSMRQIGLIGIYLMFAHILDRERPSQLRRISEICLGLYAMALVYFINNMSQYTNAFTAHLLGGDYMRYLIVVTLAGCALSFFSGHFQRDMSLCAAVTLTLITVFVDLDIGFWVNRGVHQWNQIRQILNNAGTIVGFLLLFLTLDNRIKVD